MYFRHKYGEEGILRRVKVKALWLDNPFYLRNTLAYIPRNALDNGGDIVGVFGLQIKPRRHGKYSERG